MISINILSDDRQTSLGILDIERAESIALKRSNRQFGWSKLETGRSTQFHVPANNHNNLVLNFANEADEDGETGNNLFAHYLDCEAHTDVWRELFPTWNQTNEKEPEEN